MAAGVRAIVAKPSASRRHCQKKAAELKRDLRKEELKRRSWRAEPVILAALLLPTGTSGDSLSTSKGRMDREQT
ncbi:hypothetical protein NDU88_007565 [Pleurodeles waltl]|uniref:Uncharacterized protein n=1 Tax=Pleurodeles waltl TaxID=8319 RepID=A0AAV7SSV5_PLEWA|nr:hypothetical protein NDU88_007565 [Pleurodeles waltl]